MQTEIWAFSKRFSTMDYNGVVQQCGRQRTRDYVCILVLGNHWRKRAYRWTDKLTILSRSLKC